MMQVLHHLGVKSPSPQVKGELKYFIYFIEPFVFSINTFFLKHKSVCEYKVIAKFAFGVSRENANLQAQPILNE